MKEKFPCEQAIHMAITKTRFKQQTGLTRPVKFNSFNIAFVVACLLSMYGCTSGDSNPSNAATPMTTESNNAPAISEPLPNQSIVEAPVVTSTPVTDSLPVVEELLVAEPVNDDAVPSDVVNDNDNSPASEPIVAPQIDTSTAGDLETQPVIDSPVRSLVAPGSDLATYVPAERPVPALRAPPAQPVVVAPVINETTPLPAPVVSIPPGVDTNINFPPFFENLGISIVAAGQTLTLPVIPRDQNGNIPGLFTGPLPVGARFEDNFDGTKSIVWRPLQPDVGLHEISITAVDATEPLLRTTQLARVFVQLPADESSIVNLPPAIDRVVPHRARAGDEVIIQVKGTDPNGHIPRLELLSSLDNFSFEVLAEDERIRVLRWQTVETDVGTHQLRFRVTDAIDPSMTAESTIEIQLSDPNAFVRPGPRLRTLA